MVERIRTIFLCDLSESLSTLNRKSVSTLYSCDYPFQKSFKVMIIKGENHDLNIENRLDRVSLYGSVDIIRDAEGLAQALRLKGVIDGMVVALSEEQGR